MAENQTPLMRQYTEIKRQHPDAILFFQVGDFYEMFFEDAIRASKILQITLTSRDKHQDNAIPLCGVPRHAASSYIHKLLAAGLSVALCEQTEEAGAVKGKTMLRREVTRIITPGTVIESALLSPEAPHYIAALWPALQSQNKATPIGLAFLDLSTGDFRCLTLSHLDEIESELSAIDPKEIILTDRGGLSPAWVSRWSIRQVEASFFSPSQAQTVLNDHFGAYTMARRENEAGPAWVAAGGLLGYVRSTQKGVMGSITALRPEMRQGIMRLPARTLRHLDILGTTQKHTLLHLLHATRTPMGGRLIREWMLRPLSSAEAIIARQEKVALLHAATSVRMQLRTQLDAIEDMERLVGRISLRAGQPPDFIALKKSLAALPGIEKIISALPLLADPLETWDRLDDLYRLIDMAMVDPPPHTLKEGGVIREGHLPRLDELRRFQKDSRALLMHIEVAERKRTGIESLKIRYNHVFGYFIEVSESQIKKVPSDYMRKQTLARMERFTIPVLREVEERLLGAEETLLALEAEAYTALCVEIAKHTARVQKMAQRVAALDGWAALAEVAHRHTYVRPNITTDRVIHIVDGRHPMLEQTELAFVPNTTLLTPESCQMLILTGPNMAGKSTYMKQVALIVLLAQMGSFVPAREATLGVVDQILTRMGAEDDLTRGMSTFMVEMTEMAEILAQATPQSLLILDEIGRGTSTYDGISIARAICEEVHRIGARALFATHYHELTQLSETPGVRNYHTEVRESENGIIFLRKIREGGADQSYGIHVARLAGLPDHVIKRAEYLLKDIEATQQQVSAHPCPDPPPHPAHASHPLIETLQKIDPLHLSPMQALQRLTDLVHEAKSEHPRSPNSKPPP